MPAALDGKACSAHNSRGACCAEGVPRAGSVPGWGAQPRQTGAAWWGCARQARHQTQGAPEQVLRRTARRCASPAGKVAMAQRSHTPWLSKLGAQTSHVCQAADKSGHSAGVKLGAVVLAQLTWVLVCNCTLVCSQCRAQLSARGHPLRPRAWLQREREGEGSPTQVPGVHQHRGQTRCRQWHAALGRPPLQSCPCLHLCGNPIGLGCCAWQGSAALRHSHRQQRLHCCSGCCSCSARAGTSITSRHSSPHITAACTGHVWA